MQDIFDNSSHLSFSYFFFSVYHSLFNSKYYEALALDFCGDLPHPEQPSLLVPAAF